MTPDNIPKGDENSKRPKVLIVGAGIGGLTLGILLQKAGYNFEIFEKAREIKPLGSAIAMGATMGPLLEQLGILDEFKKLAKPSNLVHVFEEGLGSSFVMDFTGRTALAGEQECIISRPELYNLLMSQIPKENVHLGHGVVSFAQSEQGVVVVCSDNNIYHGDILVGADGAYSAVRQHLFRTLKDADSLPASDDVPFPFSSVCLFGQTEVLDPEEFPHLQMEDSQFMSVYGTSCEYSYLGEESLDHDSFRISECGPAAAEAMCQKIRDFRLPGGKDGKSLTLGEYFDRTPKGLITKTILEEKVFDTCAAGAITAMQDAIALANWIATLESKSVNDLDVVFKEYYAERYPVAKETFIRSRILSQILGNNIQAKIIRTVLKYMPSWFRSRMLTKLSETRPQVSFLPLVKDKGSTTPVHQASLQKTLAIHEQRRKLQ
ncbi:hypothetical protein CPC16_011823 [Podila verticillata]|nr:hypothetical protein CPC16_011823 [Podila verticillata]